MTQLTGRVFLTLNGQRLRSKEGATLDIGGVKREPGISDSGVDGFVEGISVPTVDCEINHGADTRLEDIQAFRDGTLTFETDTRRIYTITQAWCSTPPKLSKGSTTLQFMGVECIEG